MKSALDSLSDDIQLALYHTFMGVPLRDKLIFLSRLQHGNLMPYKELSDIIGITFQRVQQLVDSMMNEVRNQPCVSGYMTVGGSV